MPDYHLEDVKWSDSDISWSFANPTYNSGASAPFSASISGQYQDAILGALQQWSSVSGLTFTRVEDSPNAGSGADIRIGFGALNTSSTGIIGDAHFSWFSGGTLLPGAIVRLEDPSQLALVPGDGGAYTYAGTQTTLQQVALHEIGHALGLDHSSDPSSAMYASSGPANRAPNGSDIAGIQSLYGAPAASLVARVMRNDGIDVGALFRAPSAIQDLVIGQQLLQLQQAGGPQARRRPRLRLGQPALGRPRRPVHLEHAREHRHHRHQEQRRGSHGGQDVGRA